MSGHELTVNLYSQDLGAGPVLFEVTRFGVEDAGFAGEGGQGKVYLADPNRPV